MLCEPSITQPRSPTPSKGAGGSRSTSCSTSSSCWAARMAPTELLAEQHQATLEQLLRPLDIQPGLLIGRLSNAEKRTVRGQLAVGAMRIVVGTHALVQETVAFHRLGLVVIDEQHR